MADRQIIVVFDKTDNASGDQPCDLNNANTHAIRRFDCHAISLIMFTGLIQRRIEEFTVVVSDRSHLSCDGRPVHMAVEDIHEDRDPLNGFIAQTQFFWGNDILNQ